MVQAVDKLAHINWTEVRQEAAVAATHSITAAASVVATSYVELQEVGEIALTMAEQMRTEAPKSSLVVATRKSPLLWFSLTAIACCGLLSLFLILLLPRGRDRSAIRPAPLFKGKVLKV